MDLRISFYGAARNVTGSCYLVEAGGKRILVDCGLFQERELSNRNWAPFPVPPKSLDAVILTHAHLDHVGRLPRLVVDGFHGTVYCTPATAEIAQIILLDSATIQEEDAQFKTKRHKREGRRGKYPPAPLYTVQDVEKTCRLFKTFAYGTPLKIGDNIGLSFHDAGHILGSSMVKLIISDGGEMRTLLFSGDVGRWDAPILNNPSLFAEADYVVVESTYGDREHKGTATIKSDLAEIVNRTYSAGGKIVIPSFAVERAQEILYHLNGLLGENKIPHIRVYLDSPMAVKVTDIFRRHPELFDAETLELLRKGDHPCDFPGLVLSRTRDESKAINDVKDPAIIIAGSGMCTGGRIKHHLLHNVSHPENTVLFVGYQANGTLGRILLEGAPIIRIHGLQFPVRARVAKINGFSSHADKMELNRWLTALKRPPRRLFVTHGESEVAQGFASWIASQTGWQTAVPSYLDSIALD